MASSENLELACLEFEDHGACYPRFLTRSSPDLFRKASDHRLRFSDRHIPLESVLGGDRFGGPIRHNFAVVDTAGKLMQAPTKAAELNCSRNSLHRRMPGMNWGVVTATARSASMSAVHRNNHESTFDERRPQGEAKTALDQI